MKGEATYMTVKPWQVGGLVLAALSCAIALLSFAWKGLDYITEQTISIRLINISLTELVKEQAEDERRLMALEEEKRKNDQRRAVEDALRGKASGSRSVDRPDTQSN